MDEQKIRKINEVVKDYFSKNPSVDKIQAKDLMPEFIKAGIFTSDHKNGLPIRNLLRELDKANRLDALPNILPERKTKNTYWYFVKR
jgi:hypothetical protein